MSRSNGAEILDELRAAIVKYVILPSEQATDAVTCYIAATYGVTAWEHATRLVIMSPEKRCGKSRLLDIIEATCSKPLITVNISPAALVRSIGDEPPTLLLDEADTIFGKKAAENNEDLRGILNAGHQRNRPYIRWDVAARKLEECPTFSMAVLAGIGEMPDTIMDRAVQIKMRRRAKGEKVSPYRRRRDEPGLREIGNRVAGWAEHVRHQLILMEPEMPVEDRAADTWEPLVAIADAAGGDWPQRIRAACISMVAAADEDGADNSNAKRLLADVRTVFEAEGTRITGLYTATLIDRLTKLDGSPWENYYGRGINSNDLASLLRTYGIKPADVREPGGKNLKGYKRDAFRDAWLRYLPRDTGDTGDIAGQYRRGDETDSRDSRDTKSEQMALTSNVTPVAAVGGDAREIACEGCGEYLDPIHHAAGTHPGCDPVASEEES